MRNAIDAHVSNLQVYKLSYEIWCLESPIWVRVHYKTRRWFPSWSRDTAPRIRSNSTNKISRCYSERNRSDFKHRSWELPRCFVFYCLQAFVGLTKTNYLLAKAKFLEMDIDGSEALLRSCIERNNSLAEVHLLLAQVGTLKVYAIFRSFFKNKTLKRPLNV